MKKRDIAFLAFVLAFTIVAYAAHVRRTCIAGLFGGQCSGDLSR